MNGSPRWIVLALPLAGVLIALCLWFLVSPAPSLTPAEKELLACVPQRAALSLPIARVVGEVACPLPPTPPPSAGRKPAVAVYPPLPLEVLAPRPLEGMKLPPPGPAHRLSLVLLDEGRKMAIVNGRVLREGDRLDTYQVARIEKNRVKLKGGKGELWINLE